MSTATYTSTFTVADIRRVFDQFAADYDMAAQSTGLTSDDHVTQVVHDVKAFAEKAYLESAHIVLQNAAGSPVRAQQYAVSLDASLWSVQCPGNSLWPRLTGGSLRVVIHYSASWKALLPEDQQRFRQSALCLPWSGSDIDTSYPNLSGTADRRYSSNGYGLERTTFV